MTEQDKKQYDCFICYRRSDSFFTAKAIKDQLEQRGISCFLDLEESNPGNFDQRIRYAIEQADNFLLLLGEHTLERCADEKDWIRQETELAVSLNKPIIPVMMSGFSWPERLPGTMEGIQYLESVLLQIEYFEEAVLRILRFLNKQTAPAPVTTLQISGGNWSTRFFLEMLFTSKVVAEVNLAFHSGAFWFRTNDKVQILEYLIENRIPLRILVNEPECAEPMLKHMRRPLKRYVPLADSIAEWTDLAERYPELIFVKVCDLPFLHRLYAIRYTDGSAVVAVKNYRYGDALLEDDGWVFPEGTRREYTDEFDYLWKVARSKAAGSC